MYWRHIWPSFKIGSSDETSSPGAATENSVWANHPNIHLASWGGFAAHPELQDSASRFPQRFHLASICQHCTTITIEQTFLIKRLILIFVVFYEYTRTQTLHKVRFLNPLQRWRVEKYPWLQRTAANHCTELLQCFSCLLKILIQRALLMLSAVWDL